MKGLTMAEIKIGDSATFTKTVSEVDVYGYAGITGDFNPAHINETYASGTMFKKRIAHGMLTAGFISTVFGTIFPGPGAIYVSQSLNFTAPVRIGDTITATCTAIEKVNEKMMKFETVCTNQEGTIVIKGDAIIMPRKEESK